MGVRRIPIALAAVRLSSWETFVRTTAHLEEKTELLFQSNPPRSRKITENYRTLFDTLRHILIFKAGRLTRLELKLSQNVNLTF